MGERVAHLVSGGMLDYIKFDDGFALAKLEVTESLGDGPLGELRLRARYGITVVGFRAPGADFTYADRDTVIAPGSLIAVAGRIEDVDRFAQGLDHLSDRTALLVAGRQLSAAVACRLEGRQERGAHLVVLHLADGGDRRAGRRHDGLAQRLRRLAGVAQHDGAADGGLHDQVVRHRPREPQQDARRRSSPRPGRRSRPGRCRRAR